jgi:hypothetical protein
MPSCAAPIPLDAAVWQRQEDGMSPASRAALALSIAVGGVLAHSQSVSIPFDKLQRDAQLQALPAAIAQAQ